MMQNFYELYNNFVKKANKKNEHFREMFINLELSLDSKEMLSFVVSECLMEDVETIYKLESNGFSNRYIDFTIRNMAEQVIEYLYIMKHPQLIKEYFGEELKEDWNGKNMLDGMKLTGAARFKKRESISNMAKDIEEKKSNNDKISLYDIFSLKAELEHHSYFNHMLDVMCDLGNKRESKNDLDYVFLIYILSAFIKIYDTVK